MCSCSSGGMKKNFFSLLLVGLSPVALCQMKPIIVERQEQVQHVIFSMKSMEGKCMITPCQRKDFLMVYSNHEGEVSHTLHNKTEGNSSTIVLDLHPENKGTHSTMLSTMLGNKSNQGNWDVFLTESIPYNLDLQFGFGDATIDLSNTSVEKLKINTGSANITVFYRPNMPNKVVLDTFYVAVGMGSLRVKQMSLARPKVSFAEVSFGDMYLDFSTPYPMAQDVICRVGAGKLIIQLPPLSVPVKAAIQPSFLCHVSMCPQLQPNEKGIFENEAFRRNPDNAISFDLDVSVGKIVFIPYAN